MSVVPGDGGEAGQGRRPADEERGEESAGSRSRCWAAASAPLSTGPLSSRSAEGDWGSKEDLALLSWKATSLVPVLAQEALVGRSRGHVGGAGRDRGGGAGHGLGAGAGEGRRATAPRPRVTASRPAGGSGARRCSSVTSSGCSTFPPRRRRPRFSGDGPPSGRGRGRRVPTSPRAARGADSASRLPSGPGPLGRLRATPGQGVRRTGAPGPRGGAAAGVAGGVSRGASRPRRGAVRPRPGRGRGPTSRSAGGRRGTGNPGARPSKGSRPRRRLGWSGAARPLTSPSRGGRPLPGPRLGRGDVRARGGAGAGGG